MNNGQLVVFILALVAGFFAGISDEIYRSIMVIELIMIYYEVTRR
jgi:hypothetical protein